MDLFIFTLVMKDFLTYHADAIFWCKGLVAGRSSNSDVTTKLCPDVGEKHLQFLGSSVEEAGGGIM